MVPDAEPICVVKANAYGHGAVECTEALLNAGAEWFAVANIKEAEQLREALGFGFELMILGHTPAECAEKLVKLNITQTVYSAEYANALADSLAVSGVSGRIRAHLKIDSGMNRLGFEASEKGVADALGVCSNTAFDILGAFSHFARADEPEDESAVSATEGQARRFISFTDELGSCGYEIPFRHICASSGIINYPKFALDGVRPGIILYGIKPSDSMPDMRVHGFRHVMSLSTRISHLHTVRAGERVSYGGTWTAERDTLVATMPIGYGDGFIRAYRGCGVMIRGVRCPIIGRICMDQCIADVSGVEGVKLFDEVGVWTDENPVDLFARAASTIPYESVCIIGGRSERVYIK